MGEPFIGEVRAVAFGGAPRNWALCNGQLMSIAQNQALFSILGTTYGGDGITTFALPNLQGRVPVGVGDGVQLGESSGTSQVTLTSSQMPQHAHFVTASSSAGSSDPSGKGPAAAKVYGPVTATQAMASGVVSPSGGTQPHENMQPYLTINYIIALTGIYPSRNE